MPFSLVLLVLFLAIALFLIISPIKILSCEFGAILGIVSKSIKVGERKAPFPLLGFRWFGVGRWLVLRWSCVGLALVLRWAAVGLALVLRWSCVGRRLGFPSFHSPKIRTCAHERKRKKRLPSLQNAVLSCRCYCLFKAALIIPSVSVSS